MSQARSLDDLTRGELAVLVREWLLAGQLADRAGMPHLISAYGREEMAAIAIDEWMGASPTYTRRTQRLLGLDRDDVETLFKGLQIDIGAPPEFMDFRLHVIDDHHGEFWLDHCGALMDVEPLGDEYVHTMCHTIEDPTFDATAMATNPRARIRPIHRPPRHPADRHPHCHWTATIDPAIEPLAEPEPASHLRGTLAATLPVPVIDTDDEGWADYRAPLDPDLRFEVFSRSALLGLAHEVAVQAHLLAMSFHHAIERRQTTAAADDILLRQLTGIGGLTAGRLRDAFGLDTSAQAVAQVLEWHPALQPRTYVAVSIDLDDRNGEVLLELGPSPAAREPERTGWVTLLARGTATAALDAVVQGVDPHYRCRPVEPTDGALAAWRVERVEQPVPEAREVALTRFSSGASFHFREPPEQPVEIGRRAR